MKATSSSGTLKATYHNGSYLLLIWKEILKVLKFHGNNSSHFKTSAAAP